MGINLILILLLMLSTLSCSGVQQFGPSEGVLLPDGRRVKYYQVWVGIPGIRHNESIDRVIYNPKDPFDTTFIPGNMVGSGSVNLAMPAAVGTGLGIK